MQPGASAKIAVIVIGNIPGPHTVPYQVSYRAGSANEVRTAAQPLHIITGPTLESVYEYPRPYYLIQSPGYTTRADMFNGMHRFLADDDGNVRLNGSPLFTFSDGKAELMSERTEPGFTWPVKSPASLMANAQDRARWQAIYLNDRILIRMDSGLDPVCENLFFGAREAGYHRRGRHAGNEYLRWTVLAGRWTHSPHRI